VPARLTKLRIEEVSLVDRGANRNALVALRKHDKPLGVDEMSLPQYRANTDPQYPVWSKRKKDKMKYRDVRAMVNKGEAPQDSYLAVWKSVIDKADEGGGSRIEREARAGKLLEQDFKEGGHMAEYLARHDREMSRDSMEAVAKRESNRDSLGSAALDQALVKIMKTAPNLNRHEAIRKLTTSEEGSALYDQHETQQAVAKAAAGNDKFRDALAGKPTVDDTSDDDNDGNGDEGNGDDGNGKDKRRKAKASRAKCKSSDHSMASAIDGDDDSDGSDDEQDDDDMEKLRRKSIAIGKALETASLVLIRKADATFSKLCPKCAAENKVNAAKCGSCGQSFGKLS
jgi:hypothetical protein